MTDRTDGMEPASSDDLIRQARQAYDPASEPVAAPPAQAEPAPAAPAAGTETVARPSDYIRAEYQQAAAPPTAPPDGTVTYEPVGPSFFQKWGRLLIGAAVVLGFIAFAAFDRTTSVEDLALGDCLRMPDAEEITSVESAPCDQDHELEVFAIVNLPESVVAPYPGEDAVATGVYELCLDRFERYIGTPYRDSIWYINAIFPTQESWEEADDREGTCVVYQNGANDEPITITGSARGSNT